MINERDQARVIELIKLYEKNEIVNRINDMNQELRSAINANKKTIKGSI